MKQNIATNNTTKSEKDALTPHKAADSKDNLTPPKAGCECGGCHKKAKEWQEKHLFLSAEFENYKKRAAKEQAQWVVHANQAIVEKLLPVVDDLERAIGSFDEVNAVQKGVLLTYEKLINILKEQGLSPMKIAKGDRLDLDFHEVLTQMPTEDNALKGKIREVVTKGYLLHGKPLRTAKVIIGT